MEYILHINTIKINKFFKLSQLHQKTICYIYITTQQTYILLHSGIRRKSKCIV